MQVPVLAGSHGGGDSLEPFAISHLQSIKSYFANDDDFNWNYGLALAATGKYREAEEALGAVQNESYR